MPNPWLQETQGLCISGVNTATRADLVSLDQLVWGTNMQVRDGKPRTRSALVQRATLPPGRVQGLGFFSQRGGMMVASIDGQLTRVTVMGNQVVQLPIAIDYENAGNLPEVWMTETQGSLVIQDGQSNPIIYNGATARRSDLLKKEVPIGTRMAYGNGRLWVVVNGNTLVAGDIVGNGAGSELQFTETTYLSGGGALFYPAPIQALAFLPTNDTSTGYGSLIVFGAEFTDTVRAEITERDLWSIVPGFQLDTLQGIGAVSSASVTRVNQDLYWRDVGGQIRSLRSARADQLSPGNSPQSREVSRITDFETAAWLTQCAGTYFDNRVYFTASPFLLAGDVIGFRNLIALDCAPLSTMRGKAPPAYDGQYSGANFVRMLTGRFNGDPRMFLISSDDDGQNRLWEMMPGVREDAYQTESYGAIIPKRIECEAEFRRFNFGNPSQLKQIVRADFYPAEISGEVEVKLYWRVGNRNQWQLCDTVAFCAKMTDPETTDPHVWKNLTAQERGKIKSFTFPEPKDSVTNFLQTVGYDFQLRLVWTGNMLIDRIDVWALPKSDQPFSNIPDTDEACVQDSVSDNNINYRIVS